MPDFASRRTTYDGLSRTPQKKRHTTTTTKRSAERDWRMAFQGSVSHAPIRPRPPPAAEKEEEEEEEEHDAARSLSATMRRMSTIAATHTRVAQQLLNKRVAFIQMQLCPITLSHLLRQRQKIDRMENLVILWQLCVGLMHMHTHGLIHRDVKPTNIFLDFSCRSSPEATGGSFFPSDRDDDGDAVGHPDDRSRGSCRRQWDGKDGGEGKWAGAMVGWSPPSWCPPQDASTALSPIFRSASLVRPSSPTFLPPLSSSTTTTTSSASSFATSLVRATSGPLPFGAGGSPPRTHWMRSGSGGGGGGGGPPSSAARTTTPLPTARQTEHDDGWDRLPPPVAIQEREEVNALLRRLFTIPSEDSSQFIRRHSEKLLETWRRHAGGGETRRRKGYDNDVVISAVRPLSSTVGSTPTWRDGHTAEKEEEEEKAAALDAGMGNTWHTASGLPDRHDSLEHLEGGEWCVRSPTRTVRMANDDGDDEMVGSLILMGPQKRKKTHSANVRELYRHGHDVLLRLLQKKFILMQLGDFGLAKANGQQQPKHFRGTSIFSMQSANTLGVGTPLYASPEQLRGDICTWASDAFSLAIVMVEMYLLPTTTAERLDVLQKAREGRFPTPEVVKEYPELSVVHSLTQVEPFSRMTMENLKSFLFEQLCYCLDEELQKLKAEIYGYEEE